MIYADENVWLPVVEGLRRRGWDVTTVLEEGMLGRPDREQLQYALENGWPFLTFDDDLLALADSIDHAGVIYISQHRRDVGELVRRIDGTLQRNEERDLAGGIVYA